VNRIGLTHKSWPVFLFERIRQVADFSSAVCLLWLVFIFAGCERVIEIDLNDSDPRIVIEANLSDSPDKVEVKVSKTANYFGQEPVEHINDASVTLRTQSGRTYQVPRTGEGLYLMNKLDVRNQATYTLIVEAEGNRYEAESSLWPRVRIDSLATVYNDGFTFFGKGYNVYLYFQEPSEFRNYYRLKIFVNRELQTSSNDYIFFDDHNNNGQYLQLRVRNRTYEKGDTVAYELVSLDKGAYDYLRQMDELMSVNPGSAAPSNPASNFSNGALGYFSAWSSDKKSIVIPK
jgi:hypothetical protein